MKNYIDCINQFAPQLSESFEKSDRKDQLTALELAMKEFETVHNEMESLKSQVFGKGYAVKKYDAESIINNIKNAKEQQSRSLRGQGFQERAKGKVDSNLPEVDRPELQDGQKEQVAPGTKAKVSGIEITYPTEQEAQQRKQERTRPEYVQQSSERLQEEDPTELKTDLAGEFGLLTAENPLATPLTEEENTALNKKAESWLKRRGYNPRRVTGKYGQAENSFFVPNLTREDAIEFVKEFNQEAVAHSDGLVYQDGSMNPRKKSDDNFELGDYTPESDFVSVVKTPEGLKTFQVGYDFDTKLPAQEAAKVKPISKMDGQSVTVKIGGKNVSGVVSVDEGGKVTINRGKESFEVSPDTEYKPFERPVKVSKDGNFEYQGESFPEARIVTENGKKKAVFVREDKTVKAVTNQDVVEEVEYQITLAESETKESTVFGEKVSVTAAPTMSEAIANSIANAARVLKIAFPKVKMIVGADLADTRARIEAALTPEYGAENARMLANKFDNARGQALWYKGKPIAVVINAKDAELSTAPHEIWHIILRDAFGNDPKKFSEFKDGVANALINNGFEDVAAYLDDFADNYDGDQIYEEYLAELGGQLVAQRVDPSRFTPSERSFIEAFKDLVNKIAREFTGKNIFIKEATPDNVLEFMANISTIIAEGGDIRPALTGKTKPGSTGFESAMQANFSDKDSKLTFIYDKNSKKFDKLKNDGFINEDVPLGKFHGKTILLHQPDAAFSGEIQKDGQTLVEGKGGLFYTAKFHDDNYLWASTKNAASQLVNSLNTVSEQNGGKILLGLTSAPFHKLLSSTTMANAVVDFFSSKAFDKNFKVTQAQLKSALIKAAAYTELSPDKTKTFGIKLKLKSTDSIQDIRSKISEKLRPDKTVFNDRKVFSEHLIKQMADHINSNDITNDQFSALFSEGIQNKYFTGVKKAGKIKISAANMTRAISEMFTEPILKEGFENRSTGGQIYAIIEVDGKVKAVNSDKHESYPVAIKAENPVKIHILKDRPLWFDVFEKQDGSKISKSERTSVYPSTGLSAPGLKLNFEEFETANQLPAKVASKLTEDGEGNYLFHHYSGAKRDFIKRSDGTGSRATSREEQRSLSAVGGLAMYYPQSDQVESFIQNAVQHTIAVPVERVYDADSDPLGFEKEARQRFERVRPGQAFDANYRVAFITQVAGDNGFDMVVAEWMNGDLRAQTIKELVPLAENKPLKPRAPKDFIVGDRIKFMSGTYEITEIDGDQVKMKGFDMYGDPQQQTANLRFDKRRMQKIEDFETASQKQLPARVNAELNDIIAEQKGLGKKPAEIAKEAIAYLKGTDAFKKLGDRDKVKVIETTKRLSGMRTQVKVDEYAALKDQITLEARAAREAAGTSKKAIKKISDQVRKMVQQGSISQNKASVIIKKIANTNFFSNASIEATLDYIGEVFDKSNLAFKISRAYDLLKPAKVALKTKIGQAKDLHPVLKTLFSFDPAMVPIDYIDDYLDILSTFGARRAVLSLEEAGEYMGRAEAILNAIAEEQENIINETEQTRAEKDPAVEEARGERVSEEILDTDLDTSLITDPDDRKIADGLKKIKKSDIDALVKTKKDGTKDFALVYKLQQIMDNIENGYVPHQAAVMLAEIESNRSFSLIVPIVGKVNPNSVLLGATRAVGKMKNILTGRGAILEQIRSSPLEFIDDILGNFNSRTVYNSTFGKLASAKGKMDADVEIISAKLNAAERLIQSGKSDNAAVASKYKIMAYLLQREFESNPGDKSVAPAIDFIQKTLDANRAMDLQLGNKDIQILENLIRQFSKIDENGNKQISLNKLKESLSVNEKKAIALIDEANQSLAGKALFTSAVIRGSRVDLVNSYIHHDVQGGTAAQRVKAIEDRILAGFGGRPSTKAGTLNERTVGAKAINFDPITASYMGAKMTLTDYHMTQPLREVMKTVNKIKQHFVDDPNATPAQIEAANAIIDALEESVRTTFQNAFTEYSILESVLAEVRKQGYYQALASIPRAVAEFGSNMIYAMKSPMLMKEGFTKFGGMITEADGLSILRNVGSEVSTRLYGNQMLTGKYAEGGMFSGLKSTTKSKTKNDVLNAISFIHKRTTGKLKGGSDLIADFLLSTPDKAISRPFYFAGFAEEFKKQTGVELTAADFRKIGEGTSEYLGPEYTDAIEKARIRADRHITTMSASDNSFNAILKNTPRKEDSGWMAVLRAANSFMSRFYLTEYSVLRSATMSLFHSGEITKKQALTTMTAVTMRMASYVVLYSVMKNLFDIAIAKALGTEPPEEMDEEEIMYEGIRSFAGTSINTLSRRTMGNIAYMPVAWMTEMLNEKYGSALRNGEDYDPFENSLVFSGLSREDLKKNSVVENIAKAVAGPYGPMLATASRSGVLVNRITSDRSKPETKEKAINELSGRMAMEAFGQLGLIPLYKDVRRIVINDLFSDIDKKPTESYIPTKKEIEEIRKIDPVIARQLEEIYKLSK